jgi:hypothetical protein
MWRHRPNRNQRYIPSAFSLSLNMKTDGLNLILFVKLRIISTTDNSTRTSQKSKQSEGAWQWFELTTDGSSLIVKLGGKSYWIDLKRNSAVRCADWIQTEDRWHIFTIQ